MTDTIQNAEPRVLELISFRIGAQEFCVEIMSVREIRGWTPATALPNSPAYVCGVINLRGTILPVVDLGQRLGLGPAEPTKRHVIVVVIIRKKIIGLLVNAVCDIITVAENALQPVPDLAGDVIESFISHILTLDSRMVGLIALDRVFTDDEVLAA
jgi:purine-binding chemotaxis protein CheW